MKKTQMAALILCAALVAVVFSCASGGSYKAYDATVTSWDWLVNGDDSNGGSSTIEMKEETQEGMPAYAFTGNITNQYEYGFVNVKLYPDVNTLDLLKNISAFSFRILGDGDRYAVKITTSDITDYAYYEYSFDTVDGVATTIIVPVEHLMQPSWGKAVGAMINLDNSQFIEFQTTRNGSPGPFAFKLWDVRLFTGGTPTEKELNRNKPKAAAPAAAKGIGGDLGSFELKLNDNFQYDYGYQAIFSDKRLFNGHKIVPGENYTLKITYTASRDLEEIVEAGLVDTTPAANYWRALTWDPNDESTGMFKLPASKAGEKVSATIKFTTMASSTSTAGVANALVFVTKGEGKHGTPNSGTKKSVTFSFTEFVFTQD